MNRYIFSLRIQAYLHFLKNILPFICITIYKYQMKCRVQKERKNVWTKSTNQALKKNSLKSSNHQ